jgi:hypothetical protein
VYGLAAAYDPNTNNFLITLAKDDAPDPDLAFNQIVIIVVPASGSSTPLRVNTLPISALHAPSIVCTGAVNRCLLTYEAADGNGSLTGTFIGVNPSTGEIAQHTTYTWGIPAWDTPGLAYHPPDDTFRFAVTDSNNAVFTYKVNNSDPFLTLYGTGDAWNSTSSQVSTAVLTSRYRGGTWKLEAWFLEYW